MKFRFASLLALVLTSASSVSSAQAVYRCNVGGEIRFQQTPCAGAGKTVQEDIRERGLDKPKRPQAASAPEQPDKPAESKRPVAGVTADFFGQPKRLCSALEPLGIRTGGWKHFQELNEWACLSALIPIGTAGRHGLPNNIAYYVDGNGASASHQMRIKVNVNNEGERSKALARLAAASEALFESVVGAMPEGLLEAILLAKPWSKDMSYGLVELIREPGNITSYIVSVTDHKYLADKQQAKGSAAMVYESCKSAVAKAAGYSASVLQGDGQPIQEKGYRSFFLQGQGRDMFFCEVHAGNRYKIKAVLGGVYPARYIAEGKF